MKAFSKTTRYLTLSLLFFAVSLSAALFSFYYVDKEGKELESKMEIVSKHRQLEERYRSLEVMVDESRAEYDELGSYLLTENNTINFLSEVETLAGSMGLTLITDALKADPLPNPKYQGITLQLRITGQYEPVLDFLKILETLPYYSRIDALSLEREGRTGETWTAAVTLLVGLHAYDQ